MCTHCPKDPSFLVMPASDTGWTGSFYDTVSMILGDKCRHRGLLMVASPWWLVSGGTNLSWSYNSAMKGGPTAGVDPLWCCKCQKCTWQETTWYGQCVTLLMLASINLHKTLLRWYHKLSAIFLHVEQFWLKWVEIGRKQPKQPSYHLCKSSIPNGPRLFPFYCIHEIKPYYVVLHTF